MARTESTLAPLGSSAPDFHLEDAATGNSIFLHDFDNKAALVVVFLSPHCPFVKHVQHELAVLGEDYQKKNVGFVAISANDTVAYPDDAPDKLKEFASSAGFTFPLLFDESQEVAKAYRAACTPDFFVYDSKLKLVYRGQLDDSRPKSEIPVTGRDIRAALDAILAGQPVSEEQRPSVGCNIKWKPGNEPAYFSVPEKAVAA